MTRTLRPHRLTRLQAIIGASLLLIILSGIIALVGWFRWVDTQITLAAHTDQTAPADVICVFGAAEYNGRPSRVLRARLEHALNLYQRALAPILITLGGRAPGDRFSEGQVGEAFLRANGVPASAIIAETSSRSTEESVARVLTIAQENHFHRILIVSDPTHVFRIQAIFAASGVRVLASPREPLQDGGVAEPETREILHEALAYSLWRVQQSLARWL